jgi:hypothetical protein
MHAHCQSARWIRLLLIPAFIGAATVCQAQELPWLSVDFGGGTVEQYIRLLQMQGEDREIDVNVILDDSVREMKLPPIKFSNVPVDAAIQILERVNVKGARVNIDRRESIYVITGQLLFPPAGPQDVYTTVLSVREILDEYDQSDVLSAIEIGLKMMESPSTGNTNGPGSSEPLVDLKLHNETGLLFVKGTDEQLDLVSRITEQLEKGYGGRRAGGGTFSGATPESVPEGEPAPESTGKSGK